MKKPDIGKLKQQATELKNKASELGNEAAKTAGGIRKGVQTGVEAGKFAFGKAQTVLNKNSISSGIDAAAKGTENVAKTLEKASDQMKKFSKKIKGN